MLVEAIQILVDHHFNRRKKLVWRKNIFLFNIFFLSLLLIAKISKRPLGLIYDAKFYNKINSHNIFTANLGYTLNLQTS